MVKYAAAAMLLMVSMARSGAAAPSYTSAFVAHLPHKQGSEGTLSSSRVYSAIPRPYDEFDDQQPPVDIMSATTSFLDSAPSLLDSIPKDDQAEVDALLARKEERRVARLRSASARRPSYQVTLPIGGGRGALVKPPPAATAYAAADGEGELASLVAWGQEIAVANSVGLSLREVYSGRKLSELALDVDTLRFQSFVDELEGRCVDGDLELCGIDDESTDEQVEAARVGSVQVLQNSALETLEESFDGVVVSSVARGGLAWAAGVRAGDVLMATSATIGSKLWPKSTLDGVRSAISSRKVISSSMDFEFRHLTSMEEENGVEAVKSFELSLSRPIGINVEDTDDGFVTITSISDKASSVVKDVLRAGDRVVSVESSVGGKMWDVFSTDGLTSAVTSRLPGQPVRLLFERVEDVSGAPSNNAKQPQTNGQSATSSISEAVVGFRVAGKPAAQAEATSSSAAQARQAAPPTAAQKMLLSRSRDLLRTYIARNEVTKNIKVVDRVLEAVIDVSAILDGRTLNLIFKAYNTCGMSGKAIQTFEEVFGLAGDGSERTVERVHEGRLAADDSALNKFTIAGLLRAHAISGDYESAMRVLAAMEGNVELSVGGKRTLSWSGKGDPFNMPPDVRCYNIALAAAAKRGTKAGLEAAVEIFDSMPNPSLSNPPLGKPAKNLVTYNTMIDAFANSGEFQNAYGVFKSLKKSNLRPDAVTYTTLIKASIKSGNLDNAMDLLDDMKWVGIQPDIVSYNNIIESLCNANRLFEAKDLVNEMEMTRVRPDSMTYGLLMKGLLRANKPGPCLTLFESAYADLRTAELMENVQLYTTAISAAAALGDHERALDLVARMNRAGVRPNKKTLTALMGACIAGKKYDVAANIFLKIKNPDSYALSVGLQALCLGGKLVEALELITEEQSGQKTLTGKQVMAGYNKLLHAALSSGELSVARKALSGLLRAGYIPSKITFRAIMDGLSLSPDIPFASSATRKISKSQPSDGKFEFLLFVLDSLEGRKLTVDSAFYSSILVLGAMTGGLHKRIASLLSRSRKSDKQKEIKVCEDESSDKLCLTPITSWEDLLENYSAYKEEYGSSTPVFPPVRVSSRDFGRVLAAEQALSYRGGRAGFRR